MSGSLPQSPWQGNQNEPLEAGRPRGQVRVRRFAVEDSRDSHATSASRGEMDRPPRTTTIRGPVRSFQPRAARFLLESLVVLALAVTVFRAFLLEGFMITTGSMAPALWGFHYRVTCPDCNYLFPVNATRVMETRRLVTDASAQVSEGGVSLLSSPTSAVSDSPTVLPDGIVCPNCKYAYIQLSTSLINEGDQLLVDKQGMLWQEPQRWDAVVFRNPRRSTQAYAKRVVGLPGEVLSLREGDVYVRGAIQRKTLEQQKQMRILISDSRYQPKLRDSNWRNNWQPEDSRANAWVPTGTGYRYEPPAEASAESEHWLLYAHWNRQGGLRKTSVPLEHWPTDIPLPPAETPLKYDPIQKQISCPSALPAEIVEKLSTLSRDEGFKQALERLFEQSHRQPVTDRLVYNPLQSGGEKAVRDLMVELDILPEAVQSQFQIRMHDGQYTFLVLLDFATQRGELRLEGNDSVLRTGQIPEWRFEQPLKLEMSLFDHQVLLAVNGVPIFEPYAYRVEENRGEVSRTPIAVSAKGAPLDLLRQRVYRDVYYRAAAWPDEQTGERTYRLGLDEYFVLGDNSAVSVDSRHWPEGSVTRSLLIGRPVLLHLPSRRAELSLGPYQTRIRVPDWDRVRMLR